MSSFVAVVVAVAVVVVLLLISNVHSCSIVVEDDFSSPSITDVFLNDADSNLLTIKIAAGDLDSCRALDTKTEMLDFLEISCDDTKKYDFTITNISKILSLDVREKSSSNNTSMNNSTTTDDEEDWNPFALYVNFLEEGGGEFEIDIGYYVDPDFYAWFYSPSLSALFILTVDTSDYNATAAAIDNSNSNDSSNSNNISTFISDLGDEITTDMLAVIFIAFDPADDDQPRDSNSSFSVDIKTWVELFDEDENLVGKDDMWYADFYYDDDEEHQIYIYDDLHIFQLPTSVACSGLPWFSYSAVVDEDLFDIIGINDSFSPWDYEFIYVGEGFNGIDDRINRAYGYSYGGNNLWWYDSDGNDGSGSYHSITFTDADLTNWWMIMWIIIVFLCCCTCICFVCCCVRKKRKKTNERHNLFHASV